MSHSDNNIASNPPVSSNGGINDPAPAVTRWYKFYAIFMVVVYAALAYLGYYFLQNAEVVLAQMKDLAPEDLKIRAIILLAAGAALAISFLASLFQPRTSGAWIFKVILIGIGLGNCCLWIITIPLMVGWLKPETQRWFGRNPGGSQGQNGSPPPIPTA